MKHFIEFSWVNSWSTTYLEQQKRTVTYSWFSHSKVKKNLVAWTAGLSLISLLASPSNTHRSWENVTMTQAALINSMHLYYEAVLWVSWLSHGTHCPRRQQLSVPKCPTTVTLNASAHSLIFFSTMSSSVSAWNELNPILSSRQTGPFSFPLYT